MMVLLNNFYLATKTYTSDVADSAFNYEIPEHYVAITVVSYKYKILKS